MYSFCLQLDSDMELKDVNSIHQLCLSCNLPAPNATNRKRLAKELLFYTVMSESISVSNSNLQRILRGILLRKEKNGPQSLSIKISDLVTNQQFLSAELCSRIQQLFWILFNWQIQEV